MRKVVLAACALVLAASAARASGTTFYRFVEDGTYRAPAFASAEQIPPAAIRYIALPSPGDTALPRYFWRLSEQGAVVGRSRSAAFEFMRPPRYSRGEGGGLRAESGVVTLPDGRAGRWTFELDAAAEAGPVRGWMRVEAFDAKALLAGAASPYVEVERFPLLLVPETDPAVVSELRGLLAE